MQFFIYNFELKEQEMKKILILGLLVVLVSCGKTKCDVPDIGTASNTAENAAVEEASVKEQEKKEKKEESVTEKGGEMKLTFQENTKEEVYAISAIERKETESNSYVKEEMKKRLNEGERYYLLTVKIKNTGENPITSIEPSYLQIETEDGVLYKNSLDYMSSGEMSSISDSYKIDSIPVGTSREIKLNYKIKGEPKSLDFIVEGIVIGKLMLK